MKVIIKNCETATAKSGTAYKHGMLNNGTEDVGFLAFPKFKDYELIENSAEIECNLTPTNDGKFFINNAPMGAKPAWAGGKVNAISGAMKQKAESIEKFQNSSEESIKLMSAARDATLLVTTFYPEANTDFMVDTSGKEEYLKLKWNMWRGWLLEASEQPFWPFPQLICLTRLKK